MNGSRLSIVLLVVFYYVDLDPIHKEDQIELDLIHLSSNRINSVSRIRILMAWFDFVHGMSLTQI